MSGWKAKKGFRESPSKASGTRLPLFSLFDAYTPRGHTTSALPRSDRSALLFVLRVSALSFSFPPSALPRIPFGGCGCSLLFLPPLASSPVDELNPRFILLPPPPIPATIGTWGRPRNSTSRNRLPSLMRKTRLPSPPSMKASAMPKLGEPFPSRKFANSCHSGLPPPLHAKGAKRSRLDHRPHCRRRR